MIDGLILFLMNKLFLHGKSFIILFLLLKIIFAFLFPNKIYPNGYWYR